MAAPASLLGYGINGIRTDGRYLYYANTGKGLLCRFPVDIGTGSATGPVEVISNAIVRTDDFALERNAGFAYIANVFDNSLLRVGKDRNVRTIVSGHSGVLIGATSAQWGRTARHRGSLYIVDSGSMFNPATGGFDSKEGGKVVEIEV